MKKNMNYFAVVLLLGIAVPTQARVLDREERNGDAGRTADMKG